MELETTVQVSLNDLSAQSYDLYLASSGYETRSIFLSQRVSVHAKRKIALAFKERKAEISRPFNDKVFSQLGFEFIEASTTSSQEICEILESICTLPRADDLNILVDYSSMPKLWYEAIIEFFSECEPQFINLNVWFSYSTSEYVEPKRGATNVYSESEVPLLSSSKPIVLIIGLGYEKARAQQLANKVNAEVTYSFYSDPAVDPRFVNEVIQNNKDILSKADPGEIIKYPIFDLNYINASLTRLCVDLRLSHQVVLASIGPKPFTLMSFLLHARYPDIRIWRFSSVVPKDVEDLKPHGEVLIYKVHFTNDNVEYDD
ncbi:MAG TPA: hypothetical protein VHO90_10630 [Bacteroidales bacterium]|nr:hypothetical protein [Bacteroidales bacterium]